MVILTFYDSQLCRRYVLADGLFELTAFLVPVAHPNASVSAPNAVTRRLFKNVVPFPLAFNFNKKYADDFIPNGYRLMPPV